MVTVALKEQLSFPQEFETTTLRFFTTEQLVLKQILELSALSQADGGFITTVAPCGIPPNGMQTLPAAQRKTEVSLGQTSETGCAT